MDAGCRQGEPDTTLYGVVRPMWFVPAQGVRGPVAPRAPCDRLDGHHADVPLGALGQQGVHVGPVVVVSQHRRVDGEHDGVQVVAPDRLEVGGRGAQVVAGHPDEPREAPVACLQDDLECLVALVQYLERCDPVHLVEVQFVHLESLQAPIQAAQGPVPFGLGGLACQEQALADGPHVGAHGPLRGPVAGSYVQVVDAGFQGLVEEGPGLIR